MTINIGQDPDTKIPKILEILQQRDIDIALLQETGEGYNDTISGQPLGYTCFQTEAEYAGAAIIIKDEWKANISEPKIIQEGRAIAVTLTTQNGEEILISSVYQYSGLDNYKNDTFEYLQAQANTDDFVAMINPKTSLAIIGGDFNNTDTPEDRIRPNPETTDKYPDQDPTFAPLYCSGFIDSHENGEMTCETNTTHGVSKSRIDRIFYWTKCHTIATETQVQKIPQMSNHSAVFTTLTTPSLPKAAAPKTKENHLNTRNASKEKKEAYAKAIHKFFKGKNKDLITRIQNWDENLQDSNNAIKEASQHIRHIAKRFFWSPPNRRHTEETKTKLKIKNLSRIIRNIETLQLYKLDKFQKNKTQRRFENEISKLPLYLKNIRAPPNSAEGRKWVQALRQEKRSKLNKLHIDRKVRVKNKQAKLSAQQQALRFLDKESHEDITTVPIKVNGKTSLTTDPQVVKSEIAKYFRAQVGVKGPEEKTIKPEWLQRELRGKSLENAYSLDSPFTLEELRRTLSDSGNSAAPGKDGIPLAILKFAILHAPPKSNTFATLLLNITQAVYDAGGAHQITKELVCKPIYKKRGNKNVTNLRPIALQNAIGKLPSKMLASRLSSDLHKNGAINSANEGFLKHRGTANVLNTILNIWEDAKEKGKPCFCVSYDVSKAFDHLRWFTIQNGMKRINLPPNSRLMY
jgi:exonuclease III